MTANRLFASLSENLNSKANTYNAEVLEKKLKRIDEHISEYLAQMNENDVVVNPHNHLKFRYKNAKNPCNARIFRQIVAETVRFELTWR